MNGKPFLFKFLNILSIVFSFFCGLSNGKASNPDAPKPLIFHSSFKYHGRDIGHDFTPAPKRPKRETHEAILENEGNLTNNKVYSVLEKKKTRREEDLAKLNLSPDDLSDDQIRALFNYAIYNEQKKCVDMASLIGVNRSTLNHFINEPKKSSHTVVDKFVEALIDGEGYIYGIDYRGFLKGKDSLKNKDQIEDRKVHSGISLDIWKNARDYLWDIKNSSVNVEWQDIATKLDINIETLENFIFNPDRKSPRTVDKLKAALDQGRGVFMGRDYIKFLDDIKSSSSTGYSQRTKCSIGKDQALHWDYLAPPLKLSKTSSNTDNAAEKPHEPLSDPDLDLGRGFTPTSKQPETIAQEDLNSIRKYLEYVKEEKQISLEKMSDLLKIKRGRLTDFIGGKSLEERGSSLILDKFKNAIKKRGGYLLGVSYDDFCNHKDHLEVRKVYKEPKIKEELAKRGLSLDDLSYDNLRTLLRYLRDEQEKTWQELASPIGAERPTLNNFVIDPKKECQVIKDCFIHALIHGEGCVYGINYKDFLESKGLLKNISPLKDSEVHSELATGTEERLVLDFSPDRTRAYLNYVKKKSRKEWKKIVANLGRTNLKTFLNFMYNPKLKSPSIQSQLEYRIRTKGGLCGVKHNDFLKEENTHGNKAPIDEGQVHHTLETREKVKSTFSKASSRPTKRASRKESWDSFAPSLKRRKVFPSTDADDENKAPIEESQVRHELETCEKTKSASKEPSRRTKRVSGNDQSTHWDSLAPPLKRSKIASDTDEELLVYESPQAVAPFVPRLPPTHHFLNDELSDWEECHLPHFDSLGTPLGTLSKTPTPPPYLYHKEEDFHAPQQVEFLNSDEEIPFEGFSKELLDEWSANSPLM